MSMLGEGGGMDPYPSSINILRSVCEIDPDIICLVVVEDHELYY